MYLNICSNVAWVLLWDHTKAAYAAIRKMQINFHCFTKNGDASTESKVLWTMPALQCECFKKKTKEKHATRRDGENASTLSYRLLDLGHACTLSLMKIRLISRYITLKFKQVTHLARLQVINSTSYVCLHTVDRWQDKYNCTTRKSGARYWEQFPRCYFTII